MIPLGRDLRPLLVLHHQHEHDGFYVAPKYQLLA